MGATKSLNGLSLFEGLSKTISLLPGGTKGKLYILVLLQFTLSVLDAIGILLMGFVASLAFTIFAGLPTPVIVEDLLRFLNTPNLSNPRLLFLAGLTASGFLVVRTVGSLFITKKIYQFLAHTNGVVSRQLIRALLDSPFSWIRGQNTIELSFAMNQGLQLVLIGITGQLIIIASEIFFLLLILTVLATVNILMTLVSIFLFTFFGLFVYFISGKKISSLADLSSKKLLEGNQQITNSLRLFRELTVRSSKPFIIEEYSVNRIQSANVFANLTWIQLLPKLSIEITIVFGAFLLSAISIYTSNFQDAISNLTIFLVATSRIAPSALRLQQSTSTILSLAGQSSINFKYYDHLLGIDLVSESSGVHDSVGELQDLCDNPIPRISFKKVCFNYEDSFEEVLSDISFDITPGEIIAIVGPSGSGKSTLFDLLLGLLVPTSGAIAIGGEPPKQFLNRNPGVFSYLPQDAFIFPGSISKNITLGSLFTSEDALVNALRESNLLNFVQTLRENLNTIIGEGGNNLSGGQRQRVALARALYLYPKAILLDEPTSALDSESENQVMQAITFLKGKSSIIVIAHRLSTLRFVDRVLYLEKGKIKALGTLADVREKVQDFDLQLKMLGF